MSGLTSLLSLLSLALLSQTFEGLWVKIHFPHEFPVITFIWITVLQSVVLRMDLWAGMAFAHCEPCCSYLWGRAHALVPAFHGRVLLTGIADFFSSIKRLTQLPSDVVWDSTCWLCVLREPLELLVTLLVFHQEVDFLALSLLPNSQCYFLFVIYLAIWLSSFVNCLLKTFIIFWFESWAFRTLSLCRFIFMN